MTETLSKMYNRNNFNSIPIFEELNYRMPIYYFLGNAFKMLS